MENILISKFSSLDFSTEKDISFMQNVKYAQIFGKNDEITIQLSRPADKEVEVSLINLNTGETTVITGYSQLIEDDTNILNYSFSTKEIGCFQLLIKQLTPREKEISSAYFQVKEYSELRDTILFTYSNNKNIFDTLFVGETYTFFNYRIKGGFLPSGISFKADTENFKDQSYSPVQLSAFPYKTKSLTVGDALGVPYWVAEKINLIFSLTDILINAVPHVRSDGSVPELTEVGDRFYPLYVYNIDLEEAENSQLLRFMLASTEWILEHGSWQDGVWKAAGFWKNYK